MKNLSGTLPDEYPVPKLAEPRFYVDADILGLAHALCVVGNDVTYTRRIRHSACLEARSTQPIRAVVRHTRYEILARSRGSDRERALGGHGVLVIDYADGGLAPGRGEFHRRFGCTDDRN